MSEISLGKEIELFIRIPLNIWSITSLTNGCIYEYNNVEHSRPQTYPQIHPYKVDDETSSAYYGGGVQVLNSVLNTTQ